MKKITIFAAGSRGDIQPCLALAIGLKQTGYQVTMAAPQDFEKFITQYGVGFYPLRGDVQKVMASDTGREFMEQGGSNPLKSIQAIRTLMAPIVKEMVEDAFEACRGADLLICLGVFSPFGFSIAEALQIPIINIEPTPLLPSKSFAAPSWPIQKNLGGIHNHVSGLLMLEVIWQWYRPFVFDFRKHLGLPVSNAARFYKLLRSTPMLSAYSPSIIPFPADWSANIHITGYFFLDNQANWLPSPELCAFLEAGPKPVCIGFGSMAGREPEKFASLVLEALAKSGQRGLLLTGWGGLSARDVPEDVFVLESAPHAWLFPRMVAVVHHGGAGTTAEGLRAGVPNIIIPFAFDQFFWGARIHSLGIGPKPIPQKKLTADSLAEAIRITTTDPSKSEQAKLVGARIRAENGIFHAVELIKQMIDEPAARI
ncbi:MAG: hypothetical protein CL609_11180 [Anaerolineaceae bacterium]|nr:hypothetical protein [Anaerolineaceae bacterium]